MFGSNPSRAPRRHRAAAALLPLLLPLLLDGAAAAQAPAATTPAAPPAAPAAVPAAVPAYRGPSYERFLRQNPDFAAALAAKRFAEAEALLKQSGDPRAGLVGIYLLLERDRLSDAWQAAQKQDEADRGEALRAVARQALARAQSPGVDVKKRTDAVNLGLQAATLAIQADPDSIEATSDKGLLLAELAALTKDPGQAQALRGEVDRHKSRAAELQKAQTAKRGRGEPLLVEGAVTKPVKISGDPPASTDIARQAGVWGDVIVDAVIDEQGNVVDAKVVKGLPMGLDQQALVAIRNWKFKPATLEGKPVKVRYDVKVPFEKPAAAARK